MVAEYNFTFQSGYIQIACLTFAVGATTYFTFQSGYIQMMLSGKA